MLDYMHQVLKAFEQCTNWNSDNSYANITSTSRALLDFEIPAAFEFQVSGTTSPYTFNTLKVSTRKIFNGSLTYLYTDADNLDKIVRGSAAINLQNATQTFNYLQSFNSYKSQSKVGQSPSISPKSLYYGKIYYPSSNLEAMFVKRLNQYSQLTIKCISSFREFNIVTCYWQRDTGRISQELIMSTNDFLCGYRYLQNFSGTASKMNPSLYNKSSLSVGAELWLGLITLSPGCSTSLRYCTHSPNTGRPLTLTLTWNPLFGHLSSSYSAKTSSVSTFCVQYDFNLYSIESNLSFGCELWKRSRDHKNEVKEVAKFDQLPKDDNPMFHHLLTSAPVPGKEGVSFQESDKQREQLLNELANTFRTSLRRMDQEKSAIQEFSKSVSNTDFTSVLKLSTSLRDKNLKVLWEGKFKGFLLSTGTELCKSELTMTPENSKIPNRSFTIYPIKFGLQLQYSR